MAQGALEVLDRMGIRRVSVYDYLYLDFNEPVYTQLRSSDYNRRRDGRVWDTPDFHQHPAGVRVHVRPVPARDRPAHCLRLLAPGRARACSPKPTRAGRISASTPLPT